MTKAMLLTAHVLRMLLLPSAGSSLLYSLCGQIVIQSMMIGEFFGPREVGRPVGRRGGDGADNLDGTVKASRHKFTNLGGG